MSAQSTPADLSVEPLSRRHKRGRFDCGIDVLNRYLQKQAGQDLRRGAAAAFVAVTEKSTVVGYYTLSAFSINLPQLPASQIKKLPKYPIVAATLLGRLAVDRGHRGRGLGEFLLMDALARSLRASSEIASYAVVVDAKNDDAVAFYTRYGFVPLKDNPNRLFLPMKTIAGLFA